MKNKMALILPLSHFFIMAENVPWHFLSRLFNTRSSCLEELYHKEAHKLFPFPKNQSQRLNRSNPSSPPPPAHN